MSKYVIIGGVAGGATTAARLRRIDEKAEIIILEKGKHISYANCGLPYYIGGVIKDRSVLLLQTPESFKARFNVDVRIHSKAVNINSDKKTVEVKNTLTGETYHETYDKLVLSPGAKPIQLSAPACLSKNIFTLRNVDDTDLIKNFIDTQKPKRAVVIGAGFIGLEMAENLHHRGIQTTVVEASSQILAPLDEEIAAVIQQEFKTENVGLYLNDPVVEFEKIGENVIINLKSGRKIETDFVILSAGVRPDVELATKAGVKLGETGGIHVNEYFETNLKDVYAIGDAIEFPHLITKKPTLSLLAGPANKQGRILANNLVYGNKLKWKGSIGTAIAKVFDISAAGTGANEKTLKRYNIPYLSTIIAAGSHSGYYPGSMPLLLKITFSPEGKLYGAQIVGNKGVDKRIDIIASIINFGGTIYDLQEIDHAYAPPYSSAKDPIHLAGYNAGNIINGLFKPLNYIEMHNRDKENTVVIDVRTKTEFDLGAIEGSINIDVDHLRDRMNEIPKNKKIFLVCGTGLRSYVGARLLAQYGYDVYNLSAGIKLYTSTIAKQENEIEANIIHETKETSTDMTNTLEVDACGLQCPGPIIKLKEEADNLSEGQRMKITATDAGFYRDIESWCNVTGNKLLNRDKSEGVISAVIQKGNGADVKVIDKGDNKTIICFSDEMDRALASFVIANGATAMGKKVTMFFTFWGLNIIKNPDKPKIKKDFMGKMFGKMMPSSANSLKLSNMNMAGIGSKMMKKRMVQKNVDMLDTMMNKALESGVNMIACQMSMDIMGVDERELIKGVHIGGVANYLEEAENANVNLFI